MIEKVKSIFESHFDSFSLFSLSIFGTSTTLNVVWISQFWPRRVTPVINQFFIYHRLMRLSTTQTTRKSAIFFCARFGNQFNFAVDSHSSYFVHFQQEMWYYFCAVALLQSSIRHKSDKANERERKKKENKKKKNTKIKLDFDGFFIFGNSFRLQSRCKPLEQWKKNLFTVAAVQ